MDMDIDDTCNNKDEEKEAKQILMILVGAPGSGKSTFCEHVMRSSARPWARICQDTINKGKSGTKVQCLTSATSALKEGKSVFIDRCNLEREQRTDFVKLGGPEVDVHAVVLDLPAKLCISRSVKRIGHEGNLQGGKAAAVVNRMLQKKEMPKLSEGFSRITLCQNENDVRAALDTYSGLGPSDTLPHGSFGQKSPDAKIQLGIMKFLKKVEGSSNAGSNASSTQDPEPPQITEEKNCCLEGQEITSSLSDTAGEEVKGTENPVVAFVNQNSSCDDPEPPQITEEKNCCLEGQEMTSSLSDTAGEEVKGTENPVVAFVNQNSSCDVPTLAFPSLSTSDFQFNNEKASDVIIEKVEEFVNMLGNARLVLVDLTHGSKILSLVRAKAAQKHINPKKFFTFVGDITRLYTGGGLRCNVIANATNWRLKPGGGGVNAAIFSAAGPALEVATMERAKSLYPGNSVVVPLPSTSPLCSREGVTHVIHVLGPNMNPHRPNCLDGDYVKGCEILQKAYTSLFEGFLSLVKSQEKLPKGCNEDISLEPSISRDHSEDVHGNYISTGDKIKRDGGHEYERSKKCKGAQNEVGADINLPRAANLNADNKKIGVSTFKAWGSWAQALYHMAMHPERHQDDLLEISDDVVVLYDLYPKAQKHLLVLARYDGLDRLADVHNEHLQILQTMHAVGMKWAEKFLHEDASFVFRLGYHSAPSMRQLHLHVISQDFNSKHLKNKKHWNSFNTAFFRDSVDVLEEISNHGKATLKDNDSLLSMELRCHRCRSAHPSIPRLKSHISNCRAPFPSTLLQNGRLVLAPSNTAKP